MKTNFAESSGGVARTHDRVVIAHGGGGELMGRLLREHVLPAVQNPTLGALTDGAVLPAIASDVVFTTDSYVVTPLEFPGGDIGRLAVAGTVNDLAVMGATPIALSLALILEEGLALDTLDRVMQSIGDTAREAGVQIVTGDTKVIERRTAVGNENSPAAGLFINTAGVGYRQPHHTPDTARIRAGDAIIINGPIAEHGLAVMSVRSGIEFASTLRTDAAPLNRLIAQMLESGVDVRFMRDATRGGLAGVLADISEATGLSVEIDESAVPLTATARHAAEMLGLDPLTVANEGKCIFVVPAPEAGKAVKSIRENSLGANAAVIGTVVQKEPALVELMTRAGGRRVVQRPYGEELPRIC